jgi:hypothetical protein
MLGLRTSAPLLLGVYTLAMVIESTVPAYYRIHIGTSVGQHTIDLTVRDEFKVENVQNYGVSEGFDSHYITICCHEE